MLKQHGGFAHASAAHDGNHAVVPRDDVVQIAQEVRVGLFQQVMVSEQYGIHDNLMCLWTFSPAKIQNCLIQSTKF